MPDDDPQPKTPVDVYIIVRIGKQDIKDARWFEVINEDKEEILMKVNLTEEFYGQSPTE